MQSSDPLSSADDIVFCDEGSASSTRAVPSPSSSPSQPTPTITVSPPVAIATTTTASSKQELRFGVTGTTAASITAEFPTLYNGSSSVGVMEEGVVGYRSNTSTPTSRSAASSAPSPSVPLSATTTAASSTVRQISPQSLAEAAVKQFMIQFKRNFRDGSLTGVYRNRAATVAPTSSNNNPSASGAASPASAVSPAVASCPPLAAGGEQSPPPPQTFSFPWAKLCTLLWEDALQATIASFTEPPVAARSTTTSTGIRFSSHNGAAATTTSASHVTTPLELTEDFASYDALRSALEFAQDGLGHAAQAALDAFCIDLNRTYLLNLPAVAPVLVQPCLDDAMSDRVLPCLRGADKDDEIDAILGCGVQDEPIKGVSDDDNNCTKKFPTTAVRNTEILKTLLLCAPNKRRDVQSGILKLLSGVEELALAWVASAVPWLTQLCRGKKDKTPMIFCASSVPKKNNFNNSRVSASAIDEDETPSSSTSSKDRSIRIRKEQLYTAVTVVVDAAKKKYLTRTIEEETVAAAAATSSSSSSSSSSAVPPRRAVLVPTTWVTSLEHWFTAALQVADASVTDDTVDIVAPPPLNTWKLIVWDSATAEWVLRPRKANQDGYSKDCGLDALPEPLFNTLWDLFGGGVKLLTTTDVPPTDTISRLAALPVPCAQVDVRLAASVLRQLGDLGHVASAQQQQAVAQQNQIRMAFLPSVPLFASIGDTLTLAAESLSKRQRDEDEEAIIFEGRHDGGSSSSSAGAVVSSFPATVDATGRKTLARCITYGHYCFTVAESNNTNYCFLDHIGLITAHRDYNEWQRRETNKKYNHHTSSTSSSSSLHQDPEDVDAKKKSAVVVVVITELRMKNGSFGNRGLDNLGNTCFMNSGLQCLSNIPKFRRAMLESHLSTISPPFATPLVFQFVQLLRDLWRSDDNSQSLTQRSCRYPGSSSVNPVGFKEAIGAKCGRFAGYEQQDAIELVEVLLDRMHDELNPVAGKKFRERRDDDAKIPVQQLSKLYWNDHLRNNDSAITRLFYRQERTRFECLECGHKATVFDAQSSLPVPVGEELYLSLDVLVMLNPLDAFTSSLVTSQKVAPSTDDTNANADNEEKQRQQQQDTQSPVQKRSSAMTAEVSADDIDRVQIRIRVPMDSSNSVIAAEVRRVLIEGNFISNQDDDKKSVILMHQVSHVAGYALLGNYHVPLKRIDEKRFLAVITPSIALLDPPPPPPPAESSGDTTTAATAPQQPLKKEEVGPQLQSPGVRVKFIFKVQATPSSYTTTRSSSGVTVSAAAIEDDNSITTAATLPFAQFSVFPRSTVTNRMIWAACRRAVARYTCVNTTRTTSDDEGGSSSPTHNTNGNEEGTASTAGSSSGLATSNLFTVGLQLGAYAGAPETAVPVNDEGLALPQYFNDNMIARVVITLTRPQVAGPPFLELRSLPVPLEHDTMLSVISNDESDSQRQKDGGLTLEKALSNMIETHVLKDDDAWYCPVCKTHRESTTEAAQFLLPEVLTIHLKRFKTTTYGAMNKINTVVQFPLELDMSPFIAEDSPRHAITSSIESSNSADNSPAKSISNTNSQTNRNRTAVAAAVGGLTSVPSSAFSSAREPMKYELTGVVYHSGSLTFGHYTAQAFCEGADSWVYYNDSSAYATTERPSPENAYILFYQRVDADAPPRPPAYFGSAATKPTAEKEVVEATPSYATAPPATTVVDDLYDLPS